jgi:hypothetical protein
MGYAWLTGVEEYLFPSGILPGASDDENATGLRLHTSSTSSLASPRRVISFRMAHGSLAMLP